MPASRLTILLGALAAARGVIGAESMLAYFILDSAPHSLEGSIVEVNPVPTQTYQSIVTLAVDCPKSASPDNDACRAEGIYPAQLVHTQGSVFGGIVTASADDSTTSWRCALGGCGDCGTAVPNLEGECTKTVEVGGHIRVVSTSVDNCYVMGHSVPLVVTAGAEKLNSAYFMEGSAQSLVDEFSSLLESMGCPSGTTATTTGSAGSTSVPSTGASATKSEPSKTSSSTGSASPSESSEGNSSTRSGTAAGLTGLAAVVLSVLVLLS